MTKISCVASSVGALLLSVGTAYAQTTPTNGSNPVPVAPEPGMVPMTAGDAPPATAPLAPPATTTDIGPPATQPAPVPAPAPSAAAAPGAYSPSVNDRDAANDHYVERGWGRELPASIVGAGFLIGGGVQDFSRSGARGVTNTGGFWSARLIAGTRQYVGLEGAYVGSAQGINALGLDSDAVLVSNGVEGAVRLNAPIQRGPSLVEPFVFGGLGWSRFHVARTAVNTSDIASDDDVMTVPYGAGLAFAHRGLMADARFTYRSTFYNDLLRTTGGKLDNWSAGAQVGFEF